MGLQFDGFVGFKEGFWWDWKEGGEGREGLELERLHFWRSVVWDWGFVGMDKVSFVSYEMGFGFPLIFKLKALFYFIYSKAVFICKHFF